MVSVECPVDGCDYSGSVGSVEAHISGSQSGDHRGKVGRHLREELVDQAEESINGVDDHVEQLVASGDGSGGDDHPESGGEGSEDGATIPPGKAVVVSTLILLVLAFGTTTSTETAEAVEEPADDQEDGDGPVGGLVDG